MDDLINCLYYNCDYIFSTIDERDEHFTLHHNSDDDEYACSYPNCDMKNLTYLELIEHANKDHSDRVKLYKCKTCNTYYNYRYDLQMHKAHNHAMSVMSNVTTSVKTPVMIIFKKPRINLEQINTQPLYRCEHKNCGKKFRFEQHLDQHITNQHSAGLYRCPYLSCQKKRIKYKTPDNLNDHIIDSHAAKNVDTSNIIEHRTRYSSS